MPRIFDNIDLELLEALQQTIELSDRADFCVGYFNLRGWKQLHEYIDRWPGGEGNCCRLLVGMMYTPQDELKQALSVTADSDGLDQQTALRYKAKLAREFRDQLTIGVPTDADEQGLHKLAEQIRQKKVVIKLFLKHSLHAKLYLLFRPDPINPIVGYLGSSNLTLRGLSHQGELNVDVMDHDACKKLERWFNDRWSDRWCIDISEDLLKVIEESWARETPIPPYHIYVKMAYHLSHEARSGLAEFRIPKDFGNRLFEFQVAAVKIAAHHLNKRNGVLIGDVVGLGKTLMATALARIFEVDHSLETLIICPKNLVKMWTGYAQTYHMQGYKVLSITSAMRELKDTRRFRLLIIDESHNLRNREGKRYREIQAYIEKNDCKVIMLSATPYNKTYLDLSSQLRLFVPPDQDLGVRPEQLLKQIGETEFLRMFQAQPRTLAAFEKSQHPDDWRDLMRLYMVRRTRSFIKDNYAEPDPANGRKYLKLADGTRSYFPDREPKTAKFTINDSDPNDQYAKMYHADVVQVINTLKLPRYGLGNYQKAAPEPLPTRAEDEFLSDLGRAGNRLIGFCRTNLFKRLESSGKAFLMSVERHILRNYIFLYAIENNLPLPIGTQDTDLLDTRFSDEDRDTTILDDENGNGEASTATVDNFTDQAFRKAAEKVYLQYQAEFKRRFKWLRSSLFDVSLAEHLKEDACALFGVLSKFGKWDPSRDAKLDSLHRLLSKTHKNEKVLVFSQFADTVSYLNHELQVRGLTRIEEVTGESSDPTALAWRFAPIANEKTIAPEEELRILVTTDILSEGQNLQDSFIVVNYDLPWAIIRLIQRAGRVDRIGQKHDKILCYSFLPAEGVERVINLRGRVRQRLKENAEVVGADEAFFEDDQDSSSIVNLYNEKSGILDGDDDSEVDLASYAYQIWQNAIEADPGLKKTIEAMPDVVYSTKSHRPTGTEPEGVLVYMSTSQGNDMLAWIDENGNSFTESQLAILRAAECKPETPALQKRAEHHNLVQKAVTLALKETAQVGGQLGRPSGARFRTYERLKNYAERVQGQVWDTVELRRTIEEIYKYPLRQTATDSLNRQLRAEIGDYALAELCISLRSEGRLCQITEEEQTQEPKIICSLGLTTGE